MAALLVCGGGKRRAVLKGWTNEYIGINELSFQRCLALRHVNDNIENVRRARTEVFQVDVRVEAEKSATKRESAAWQP